MTMKYKIDWEGTLYLANLITLISSLLYSLNDILECIETQNYHVWICNQSLAYWITHITFLIWVKWTLIIVIKLICFKWDIQD